MLVSILIIAISLFMFVYWSRHICILILRTKTPRDYAAQIATTHRLDFIHTHESLADGTSSAALGTIHSSLERDYSRVIRLLQNGSPSATEVENHIMRADFRMMNVWYRVMCRVSPQHARLALLEMSSIVGYLANAIGEADC